MKKILFPTLCALLLMTGCDNFEQININPNNPPTVPPEMLLPPIISTAAGSMTASGTRAGQYVQHLSYLGGTSEGDGRYNLTGASWREEWNAAMRSIKDINQLIDIAVANGQPEYEAVGYICKVYTLSLMTDAYGDIPYEEAGKGDIKGLEFPHFQAQKDVYAAMLVDLEKANVLLAGLTPGTTINRDILYNGNMALWRKFANSLKLRILMRQSQKADAGAQIAHIFNAPSQYPVFESVANAATLVYNNNTDNYRWFMTNPPADGSGVNFTGNERVSNVMVDALSSLDDPRLHIYAAPTKNSWDAHNIDPSAPLEYRGQRAGLSSIEQEELYDETGLDQNDFSVIGKRIRKENRAFLMTYAELLLIKAEAIHRGMITGDAAAVYASSVRASMDKWARAGQDDDQTTPYISEEQKTAYFAQPAAAFDPAKGAEQIAMQAWIDSYLNGFEGWASWRRLGYPHIVPGPSVLAAIPVRYVYSDNEQNNPNLVKWVDETMGGDMPDHNVKVWFQP